MIAAVAALFWLGSRTRVLAIAALAAALALIAWRGPSSIVRLVLNGSGSGIATDLTSRTELWSRAIAGIQDFPLTGMGMNAFRKTLPAVYPLFLTPTTVDVAHAHNHLLQAALDLGIPGLVAYGAIWLGASVLLVRVYRRSPNHRYRTVAGGLGAGLVAHFMFGMTDAIPLGAKVGVLFWLALALAVSLHQVALGDRAVGAVEGPGNQRMA
jgi:putative inorganic carbon (HCO3(-)) transporter